ncbi:MAG: uroporphyrinogen-III C-methyltransferase [Candidatus Reconcilbacillus cellulovorans]|uniref:Uroporphyrinogen-III C-methyltransferase n=1 Tax=Candidatus Reconcilbacillus cellulovorans TaxID=1906605 RepID=A0A2A6E208_9BACL|nr:MAG: uroporphyrinogen-III C-methyltransferase [Candidatus Reconcilbacillus cellulovorans]
MASGIGKVYLVGAGPGDAKLLTIRGLEALRKADAVVYDRLVNPRLLRYAKPEADKIFVGKEKDNHILNQDEINRLLVELAKAGKTVVRLKGGDPAVFGRLGEEAVHLVDNGVPFEIVPGVSSATAVPAYAGIPVTHREYASSLSIVAGHEFPNKTYPQADFAKLAEASGTLVFLMGVSNLGTICAELRRAGKPPDFPMALIRWGTWMEQTTLTGTLADIERKAREAEFGPPAVIVAGEVVRLRDRLAWFEQKPLFGLRVLITRDRGQSDELADRIDELGGEPVECPMIRIRPTRDPARLARLDAAIDRLDEFDWIMFTSANGVEHFFRRMRERSADVRRLARARIAVVGEKTAAALADSGLKADVVPDQYEAERLLEVIRGLARAGERALLPRGDIAREMLPDGLRAIGLEVEEVVVYENVPAEESAEAVRMLSEGAIHAVVFTSSSTVRNFVRALRDGGVTDVASFLMRTAVVCIGPVTAGTAEEEGMRVTRVARRSTVDGLIEALVDVARERRKAE